MRLFSEVAVTVTVHAAEPLDLARKPVEEQEEIMRRECNELERHIKRHCDVESTSVICERAYACGYCGSPWTADNDKFNGGCCMKDYTDAPWQDYADSGEVCPQSTCKRPPFRFLDYDGYIRFECKCGEQWERKNES